MIFQNCFHFHEKQELGPVLFNHFIYEIEDMFWISCNLDAKLIRECFTHYIIYWAVRTRRWMQNIFCNSFKNIVSECQIAKVMNVCRLKKLPKINNASRHPRRSWSWFILNLTKKLGNSNQISVWPLCLNSAHLNFHNPSVLHQGNDPLYSDQFYKSLR